MEQRRFLDHITVGWVRKRRVGDRKPPKKLEICLASRDRAE